MKKYILFIIFSLICGIIHFCYQKYRTEKLLKYYEKKSKLAIIKKELSKLEEKFYIFYHKKYFSKSPKILARLSQISDIIDNCDNEENMEFTDVSLYEAFETFEEYQKLNTKTKYLYDGYRKLINELFQCVAPKKYYILTFKKKIELKILSFFVRCYVILRNIQTIKHIIKRFVHKLPEMLNSIIYDYDSYSANKNIAVNKNYFIVPKM